MLIRLRPPVRSPNARRLDGTRGQVVPMGCYLLQSRYEVDGSMLRGMGYYLVTRSLLDYAIFLLTGIHQTIHDERKTLRETFAAPWTDAAAPDYDGVETLLSIMTRLNLYLGSENAQVVERRELGDERARLAARGAKHLGKAERRLSCMCDWLAVGDD
jgi:hypothetical protein